MKKKLKRKVKKQVVKLTPLQRANRKARDLKRALVRVQAQLAQAHNNHEFRAQRATEDAQRAAQAIADKQKAIAARDETIAQRDAVIRLRDERIGDLTNERNRIVRIVDQFTSVQILSHGTELRVSSGAPSAPAALRLPVPGLVAQAIQQDEKNHAKTVLSEPSSYRKKMYGL